MRTGRPQRRRDQAADQARGDGRQHEALAAQADQEADARRGGDHELRGVPPSRSPCAAPSGRRPAGTASRPGPAAATGRVDEAGDQAERGEEPAAQRRWPSPALAQRDWRERSTGRCPGPAGCPPATAGGLGGDRAEEGGAGERADSRGRAMRRTTFSRRCRTAVGDAGGGVVPILGQVAEAEAEAGATPRPAAGSWGEP